MILITIVLAILLFLSVLYIISLEKQLSKKIIVDTELQNEVDNALKKKQEEYNNTVQAIDRAWEELRSTELEIEKKSSELQRIMDLIPARDDQLNTIRESIAMAKDNYDKELEIKKKEADASYQEHVTAIQNNISDVISAYGKQCESLTETIHTYENYINSFIEAKKRALEQENNLNFYKLDINEIDIDDIQKLLKLSNSFNKPDILRKLVYKTYFEKAMNDLLGRVIGINSEVSGVYKITHIDTKMCYIGQAVNLKERWRKHLKCGLGIDTPSTNAFYQAMIKYQPWNFIWEVLEYCPKEKLNEVEKYYIDFYQAKSWGWNSKGGNK